MNTRPLTIAATLALAIANISVAHAQQQTQQQQTQQQQQQQQQAGALAAVPLTANLTGSEIVGDTVARTGSAKAELSLMQATKEVCYNLTLTELQNPTAAHIHKAAKGENGPSVLTFQIRTDTTVTKACAKAEDALFTDIVANPANYYVQVHTAQFPRGAIRGQLVKPPLPF
jgi:hypothetical protein